MQTPLDFVHSVLRSGPRPQQGCQGGVKVALWGSPGEGLLSPPGGSALGHYGRAPQCSKGPGIVQPTRKKSLRKPEDMVVRSIQGPALKSLSPREQGQASGREGCHLSRESVTKASCRTDFSGQKCHCPKKLKFGPAQEAEEWTK